MNFKHGDRVFVTDTALAQLRAIMRNATGQEPEPNHHGTIEEVWDDGTCLIYFDDGQGAPYPAHEVRHLPAPGEKERQTAGLGLTYDCPRCGTKHYVSCCHDSRHNLCDACVHEQHEARALRLERKRKNAPEGGDA